MEIYKRTKDAIVKFMGEMETREMLDPFTKQMLQKQLNAPEPYRKTLAGIHRDIWMETRARFGLAAGREEDKGGMLGKLDSLLIASHGFAVLFTVAALAPVLFIYRQYTWILPFVLINPLWHLYASRVLAKRLGDAGRAEASHVKAALFAVVPLAFLYGYCVKVLAVDLPWFAIPFAWLVYSMVLAAAVRSPTAWTPLVWSGAIAMNAFVVNCGWQPTCQILMAGNAAVALALLLTSQIAERRDGMESPWRWRGTAGFFMVAALALACAAWTRRGNGAWADGMPGVSMGLFLTLPLFVAAFAFEAASPKAGRSHRIANLAALYALLFYVHYAPGRGSDQFSTVWSKIFVIWVYLLVLSWSLEIMRRQIADPREYHDELFEVGMIGIALCYVAAVVALVVLRWWFVGLPLSIWVLALARRKLDLVYNDAPRGRADAEGGLAPSGEASSAGSASGWKEM